MAMCLIFFFVIFISASSLLDAKINGFSVDLIHRDSPESPVYDSSLTSSQRLTNALHRSFHRAHHFSTHSMKLPSANLSSDHGEYLMNISIGTPPVPIIVITDTGSDLIWTQCQPCLSCFKQNYPLFSPKNSSSYKKLACLDSKCWRSFICQYLNKKSCTYSMSYDGNQSFSSGDLATDTLRLSNVSIENIVLGCGHHSGGIFSAGSSGIIGLGGGEVSFISQLRSSIHGKFSYCLVPIKEEKRSSKIYFGHNGLVSGAHRVTTPLVPKSRKTYYFLTLEGISVGTQKLDCYDEPKAVKEGNIVIDSGTTLTFLPSDFYTKLEYLVRRQIMKKTVNDPQNVLSLCYTSLSEEEIPDITMHFKNADLKLKADNIFVQTSDSTICLAFAEAQHFAIYGNIAQSNFLIEYNLEKKTVSFEPTDCTKLKQM